MIKLTQDDLRRRNARELKSLFNQIQKGVGRRASTSPEQSAALAVLALILAEQARRGPDP